MGINLAHKQLEKFNRYYDELTTWNSRINLTGITEYSQVLIKHFLDSLTATMLIPDRVKEEGSIIDVGTGAGFPGIPMKIAFPGLHLALVESVAKKVNFLHHIVDALELSSTSIHHDRAEKLGHAPALRGKFDVVVGRSVASMATLMELTVPFCRSGGLVIVHKKGDITREVKEADNAFKLLNSQLVNKIRIDLQGLEDERCLVVIRKLGDTPGKYPRRPGIPRKRPL